MTRHLLLGVVKMEGVSLVLVSMWPETRPLSM